MSTRRHEAKCEQRAHVKEAQPPRVSQGPLPPATGASAGWRVGAGLSRRSAAVVEAPTRRGLPGHVTVPVLEPTGVRVEA